MSIRAARTRRDESLIIIIHKTLRWESARRETKQERCAAKQERVPSLASSGGLLMSSLSLVENRSIPRREGGVLESVEQKPNHFRRLRPLGRRDADVGWRTPFLFASHSLVLHSLSRSSYTTVPPCLFLSHTVLNPPTLLDLDQHRNRPQIYCLESARMEASSTRLMTYQGCRFLLTGFFRFCSLISRVSCRSLFLIATKIADRVKWSSLDIRV